ncbi:hypothetical protein C1922_10950 [Stenotrophomonas sp. ZAC14D2_NAIMI4_7]|uniref:hypothetical protein n=1 Tax=Stenotrophomonas sp. ZAC14D2_NAIMI4_7 TaxID=2072405 RepID=UPI000D53EBCD|nr:hypothetical protein [Stenotrophomonas sp. ZAC14D2_NAIMI4_7]AWH17781.1 hypothetical protein C1922_10950 [Stenotrophomonas sp. ZAC14D2_NAIMI4_7]
MKVELQRQSLRLSLDHGELTALLSGESVENMTRFGGLEGWGLALSLHAGEQPVLLDGGTFCRLVLPRATVQPLAERGTAPVQQVLYLDDGSTLQVQVLVVPAQPRA